MTPNEILQRACDLNSFPALYYDDPVLLRGLLLQAFGKYQDKCGITAEVSTPADKLNEWWVELPHNFLSIQTCVDFYGHWHGTQITSDGKLYAVLSCKSRTPFKFTYFIDLRGFDVSLYLDTWQADTEYRAREHAVRTSAGEFFFCIKTHTSDDTTNTEPAILNDDADDIGYDPLLWKPYNLVPKGAIGKLVDYLAALIRVQNMAMAKRVSLATGLQDELPDESTLNEMVKAIEEGFEEQAMPFMVTVRA